MARLFTIKLTLGTYQGPYTIYYDQVSLSNIATINGTSNLAENLTISEIRLGGYL